LEGRNGAVI